MATLSCSAVPMALWRRTFLRERSARYVDCANAGHWRLAARSLSLGRRSPFQKELEKWSRSLCKETATRLICCSENSTNSERLTIWFRSIDYPASSRSPRWHSFRGDRSFLGRPSRLTPRYRSQLNFKLRWNLMEGGSTILGGAKFGFRLVCQTIGGPTLSDVGCIPRTGAGSGSRIPQRRLGAG